MRPVAVAAVCGILASSLVASAQQPTETATFRTGTTLVDFTIVAVDGDGRVVTDLRRDEISLFEGGQPRDIAFFQFEGSYKPGEGAPSLPLPSGAFSNHPDYAPNASRNLIAVVLDFANASLVQQFELRAQFLHYLKQIPGDAKLGLYVIRDRAVAVHDFTQDSGTLRARIDKRDLTIYERALASTGDIQRLLAGARPEQRGSLAALAEADNRAVQDFNLRILRERRQRTLASLDSVGSHLAGLPGRKSLVWITRGFPLTNELEPSYVDEVRGMSQRLASRDIAVYPVDGAGLAADRGSPLLRGRIEGTSELVADITGGRVTRNSNDLTLGLSAAAEDLRGTYSLGFYAAGTPDDRWHRVQVRVSRPGITLRHREGYLAARIPPDQRTWSEAQWNDVAYRPLISTAVRLEVRPATSARNLRLSVDIWKDDLTFRRVDGVDVAEVDVAVVEKIAAEPTNVVVKSASIELLAGVEGARVPLATEFVLNQRTTSVRLIVRDKWNGRYGSLELPLDKGQTP